MRIALALKTSIQGRGGVEQLVRVLLAGLPQAWEIHLISADDTESLISLDVGQRPASHYFYRPGEDEGVIKWLHSHGISLCHFHLSGTFGWTEAGESGALIEKVCASGIPCLTTNHQAIGPSYSHMVGRPLWRRALHFARRWPAKRRQLAAVKAEVLVSRHDYQSAARWFPGQMDKLRVIYHSRMASAPIEDPSAGHDKIILCMATVCLRKGQDVLAEAFARIAGDYPDWRLRLVGTPAEASCLDRIEKIITQNKLGGRIVIAGASDSPDTEIARAGIYVQPSLVEGLGLSLQEAMWHGIPCIASAVGGIPEMIDSEDAGVLVPPGDPSSLAVALRTLIADPAARARYGRGGRNSVDAKGMHRHGMIKAYLGLYEQLA